MIIPKYIHKYHRLYYILIVATLQSSLSSSESFLLLEDQLSHLGQAAPKTFLNRLRTVATSWAHSRDLDKVTFSRDYLNDIQKQWEKKTKKALEKEIKKDSTMQNAIKDFLEIISLGYKLNAWTDLNANAPQNYFASLTSLCTKLFDLDEITSKKPKNAILWALFASKIIDRKTYDASATKPIPKDPPVRQAKHYIEALQLFPNEICLVILDEIDPSGVLTHLISEEAMKTFYAGYNSQKTLLHQIEMQLRDMRAGDASDDDDAELYDS